MRGFIQPFGEYRHDLERAKEVGQGGWCTGWSFKWFAKQTFQDSKISKLAAFKIAVAEGITAIVSRYTLNGSIGGVSMVVYVMSEGYSGTTVGGSFKKSYTRVMGIVAGSVWPALVQNWGACSSW